MLSQTGILQSRQQNKSEIKHFIFQISPYLESNKTKFSVRKELTPVDGDTKCSIYLEDNLDYEIYSSYVLQIVAEVNNFLSELKKIFHRKNFNNNSSTNNKQKYK